LINVSIYYFSRFLYTHFPEVFIKRLHLIQFVPKRQKLQCVFRPSVIRQPGEARRCLFGDCFSCSDDSRLRISVRELTGFCVWSGSSGHGSASSPGRKGSGSMGGSCVFEGAGESRFNCTLDIARSRPLIMITSLLLVKWGGERGSKDWWKGWCKGVRGRTIATNDAQLC